MSRKKRNHYVPEFYLRSFIDPFNPPYLWVYEKGNPEILKVSVKDAAVKKEYYTVSSENGKRIQLPLRMPSRALRVM